LLSRAAAAVLYDAFPIVFCATVASLWLLDPVHSLAADSWLSLLGGREITAHGLPHHDVLAVVSHGRSWVDQQWLAQLAFYGLAQVGGFGLLIRVTDIAFLIPLALCIVAARKRGASPSRTTLIAAPALLFTGSFVRAQVFSQLLFVLLLLLLLSESRQRSFRFLLAFPLLALWANLHGAVVIGAALTAALGAVEAREWLGSDRRPRSLGRPAGLIVGPWLCVLATPYGPAIADYYRATIGNPLLARYINEWRSPAFLSIWGVPFFALVFVAIFLAARNPRSLNSFEAAALVLTMGAGLLAVRSVIWFMYASAILLPRLLEEVWPARQGATSAGVARGARLATTAFAVGLALVLFVRPIGSVKAQWPDGASASVVRVLKQDPQAKVLANDKYADWLLYRVPAARGRIAFDGRWEILSRAQFTAAMSFIQQRGADWDRAARGYRLLVLDPARDAKLAATYRKRHWHVLYRDSRFIVLDRGEPG
jgi:hypothetical protein